ncbi:MAG: deoxynucleoside kinase, partial [Clostridia bacterium]|nr:deoxynucleoside kinase [Clostridia bacterium]
MGKLIVIEGLDGSGKSTQTKLVKEYLESKGADVHQIKLPDYESDSSALVRMYLRGEFGSSPADVGAYAASSFYAVDRYANFVTKWKEDYESGRIILADRYATSNAAHQMTKLARDEWDDYLAWLEDFEYVKIGIPKPSLVVFLDMPVEISQKLMTSRYSGDEGKKDVHEA